MSDDSALYRKLKPYSSKGQFKKECVASQNEQVRRKYPTLLRRNLSPDISPVTSNDLNTQPNTVRKRFEGLTRFIASEGLSFDILENEAFRKLIVQLDPQFIFPTSPLLTNISVKMGAPEKLQAIYWKAKGPISVTMDVVEKSNGDNYLAFTVHYYEQFDDRKCLVFLRRMLLNEIEAENTVLCIRRAISNFNYSSIKIGNFVLPNPRVAAIVQQDLLQDNILKEKYISFYHYISIFANSILEIPVFATAIQQLRNFVKYIKQNSQLYCSFRKEQLTKKEDLNLPALDDDNSWQSTTTFLARCLILHYTFHDFSGRKSINGYISHQTFGNLTFLFQVLQQCAKYAKNLSGPLNSISQVIPAVMSIRNYIKRCLNFGYSFEKDIRDEFSDAFQELTSGAKSRQYDIATILDPRYAYDETVYSKATWSNIEKLVMEKVINMPLAEAMAKIKQSFLELDERSKLKAIAEELTDYRKLCTSVRTRPEEFHSPFKWWDMVQCTLPILAVTARDALTCPAVTIDAQYFFGTNGKFSRLCETYDLEQLQCYLNIASSQQEFRGYGAVGDGIPPRLLGALHNNILRRRQVDFHFMKAHKQIKATPTPVVNIREDKKYMNKKKSAISDLLPPQLHEEVKQEPNGVIEMEVKFEPSDAMEMEPKLEPSEELEREVKIEPDDEENQSNVQMPECSNSSLGYHYKEPVVEEIAPEVLEENVELKNQFDKNIPTSNNLCGLCNISATETLTPVTSENEKTFLLLGGVLSRIIDLEQACTKFDDEQPTSFFCQSHFQQSAEAIMGALDVHNPGEIIDCDEIGLNRIANMLFSIRGFKSELCFAKMFLASSTNHYWTHSDVAPSSKRARLVAEELFETTETIPSEQIIPKESRVPRKQVFENDLEETVKLIEEEPFVLPKNANGPDAFGPTVNCCFCQMTAARCYVVKVPKSKAYLDRWESKLGDEFMKRLNPEKENYVCKAHFSCDAFSSRGRLLKGHFPKTEYEKVEVTYKIKGNQFLKIDELIQGNKIKSASVELATADGLFGDVKPKRVIQENIEQFEDIKLEEVEFETCRLCFLDENVEDMKKVPENKKQLDKWTRKLGEDFIGNLESSSNNYSSTAIITDIGIIFTISNHQFHVK